MKNQKISINKVVKKTKSGKKSISKSLKLKNVYNKLNHFIDIIENTIVYAQKYKVMDIISASELNVCLTDLEKLFERIMLLKKNIANNKLHQTDIVNKIQSINNELSALFKNYGTKNMNDLLTICFGVDYLNETKELNAEKANIICKYIHPISYKLLDKSENTSSTGKAKIKPISKNKIVEDFMIVDNAENWECFDLARTSNNFQTKVYGIKVAFQNTKLSKTLIVSGIIDDLIIQCIDDPYVINLLNALEKTEFTCVPYNDTNKSIFYNFINSLTLKELLVYNKVELEHKFCGYMSQSAKLKSETIADVVKEFINAELYKQRKTLTMLLINDKDPECHYFAYLLYDLLSNENNSSPDTYEQTLLFDSLPWNIKKHFKTAMKTTISYTKSLSNFDNNKIPIEQQICLMKTTDAVKEKAMIKLKEVKAKSEDSGSKARQFLDGLLKIPFGVYRKEKILTVVNDINDLMTKIVNNTCLNHNNSLIIPKANYSTVEINNYINFFENDYISQIENENLVKIKNELTSGKRDKLITNIFHINSIIKKQKNKKLKKICHSGKKNKEMKDSILSTIESQKDNENFMRELYAKFKNPQIKLNQQLILSSIKSIKEQQKFIHKNMVDIRDTLNKSVHGHENAKRQIERIIGQWITGKQSGYCFGFEGAPGIGKTSIVKNGLSKCLKNEDGTSRPFAFIAIGGSSNASTLSGHNYTYVGSTWGRIVDILMEKKCMNPIIFIDELDKVSRTEHGKEIIGILTHLVDPTQNSTFQDKYFSGIDLDLSKVLFIFSYNDPELIDRILLDRIHRIKFDHLSLEDKLQISKQFILPEIYNNIGIENIVDFNDELLKFIIRNYTRESGVRKLKEILFEIVSEINLEILNCTNTEIELPVKLTEEKIKTHYLKERHEVRPKIIHTAPEVGIINGLWANALGLGGIIPIECNVIPSANFFDLKLTGMQGDVMKESMNVAKTLAWKLTSKSNQQKFIKNIDKTKIQGLHIHCPEGAVPKDGPSAGAAITTCIYSVLNNKKINNTIAMTGEINLQGRVTAIGGLELKILGGITAGVKTFLYPQENKKAFDKFMDKYGENPIIDGIEFHSVENIQDVFKLVFN